MSGLRKWLEEQVALDLRQAFTARQREEAAFKRTILELHKAWPVLVEEEEPVSMFNDFDPQNMAFRASRKFAWATEQAYIKHFGTEPPTTPILREMAMLYRNRAGFDWRWLG